MSEEKQQYKISHVFLVAAPSSAGGAEQVERYLQGNQLITYADLVIRPEEIISGGDARFWGKVDEGVGKNMEFAASLLDSLRAEGIDSLEGLLHMQEGYLTKVLHTLTHLLDGFIGVDSVFYNLVEDSHRVSANLRTTIAAQASTYWLVPVRTGMLEASVLHV